jgi:hypothetical protein
MEEKMETNSTVFLRFEGGKGDPERNPHVDSPFMPYSA